LSRNIDEALIEPRPAGSSCLAVRRHSLPFGCNLAMKRSPLHSSTSWPSINCFAQVMASVSSAQRKARQLAK
jgi:hypothetical protein